MSITSQCSRSCDYPELDQFRDYRNLGQTTTEEVSNIIYHLIKRTNYEIDKNVQNPILNRQAKAHHSNQLMRTLISTVCKINILKKLDNSQVPFPGKPAKFIHSRDNWEIFPSQNELIRKLEFVSETNYSLFKTMIILGYRAGHIGIQITFNQPYEMANTYLQQLGFNMLGQSLSSPTYICFSNHSEHEQLKKLFKVITTYNEFPKEYFSLINALVESGDWRKIHSPSGS